MIVAGAAVFFLVGLVFLLGREPLSRALALTLGGRLGTGCVVAIAAAFLVLGVAVLLFRELLA